MADHAELAALLRLAVIGGYMPSATLLEQAAAALVSPAEPPELLDDFGFEHRYSECPAKPCVSPLANLCGAAGVCIRSALSSAPPVELGNLITDGEPRR